jgi:hypothetical protein
MHQDEEQQVSNQFCESGSLMMTRSSVLHHFEKLDSETGGRLR